MKSFNEYGRSMIEMLGVLAIIGVLSAGGVWGYNLAMKNYRMNKTIEDLNYMQSNIIDFARPPYKHTDSGITGQPLCQAGVIPSDICKTLFNNPVYREPAYSQFKSRFGGKLTIFVYIGHHLVVLFYPPVEAYYCVRLLTYKWQSNNKYLVRGQIDDHSYFALPITEASAKSICNTADLARIGIVFSF